jgi:hypothetical protein
MSHIKADEVKGYHVGENLVCVECIEKEELESIKEDDIFTESGMEEEDYYFCDRCKEQFLC